LFIRLTRYRNGPSVTGGHAGIGAPPDINTDSIANWIDGIKPVVESESHFLDARGDLVSFSGGHESEEFLEHYLEKNWHRFSSKGKLSQEPCPVNVMVDTKLLL
jgi:hypothetical protein